MNDVTRSPWTPQQVDALNHYQRQSSHHPFTCGKRNTHPNDPGILTATPDGWTCPAHNCDYTQGWAWDFMAQSPPPDSAQPAPKLPADSELLRAAAQRLRAHAVTPDSQTHPFLGDRRRVLLVARWLDYEAFEHYRRALKTSLRLTKPTEAPAFDVAVDVARRVMDQE